MPHNRKIIYIAGFLFSMSVALTSYINSSFLEILTNTYYVGAIYVISSIATILCLLAMPKILTALGNRQTTIAFSFLTALSFLVLAFGQETKIIIPAFIINFISINLIIASLDIFIEDFSKNYSVGKLRGLYLMFINLAWVIAQTISGSIIAKSSFSGIYIVASIFMLLVMSMFFIFLRDFKDPKYIKVPIINTLKFFSKNKNILKIYILNFILKFFFAWMVIYTPIYLHEYMNFNWNQIGIIFTIMLIPFVILDFPLGKLSDKIGEKKLLLAGFITSIIFTFYIPYIHEPNLIVWAFVLFGTRLGAATLEIMTESYFFKSVKEENADVTSFFRNTTALSYIIAPLCAIPLLIIIPSFEYLFFILATILLVGFLITLKLKDVK